MLGPQRGRRAEYVSQSNRARHGPTNEAAKQANSIMRSQRAMVDAQLGADFDIVKRESIYLPNFLAKSDDFTILNHLIADLEREQHGMVNWSQHLKHENPEFSSTFLKIIAQMQVRCALAPCLRTFFHVGQQLSLVTHMIHICTGVLRCRRLRLSAQLLPRRH